MYSWYSLLLKTLSYPFFWDVMPHHWLIDTWHFETVMLSKIVRSQFHSDITWYPRGMGTSTTLLLKPKHSHPQNITDFRGAQRFIKLFLCCSYRALLIIKSHNIQSNKMHSVVSRYFMLQYLVDQSYMFRSHMGSSSRIHIKVIFHKTKIWTQPICLYT
jgi:hypothetical protein